MKKRIALVGCGTWGQNILRELVYLDALVDVFEINNKNKKQILELGANMMYNGLPAPEQYDGTIIATPSTTHREVLEQIYTNKVPFFLEKPLTTSVKDVRALEELKPDNIFLMHVWLYHPGIQMMKQIAQSGELGNVLGLRSTRANWTSPRKDTDSAWNLLPHDITIAKSILGHLPNPKSAIAERHNGIIRGLTALLGDEPYCIFEVSNRYERKIREVRLHCEKGVAILEDEKTDQLKIVHGTAEDFRRNPEIEKRKFDDTPPLRLEIKEFLNYLDGGPAPASSFYDGAEVVKIIDRLITLSK